MKAAVTFLVIMLCAGGLVFLSSPARPVSDLSPIIWTPSGSSACSGGFAGEAVVIGRPYGSGCGELWAIMTPPSEKGNLTAEAQYLEWNGGLVEGVFLDDFGVQNASTQAQMLAAVPSSYAGSVCPVIYPFTVQPASTVGAQCVVLAMDLKSVGTYEAATMTQTGTVGRGSVTPTELVNRTTVAEWNVLIRNATSSISAKKVMLLLYDAPYSYWEYPIPQNYVTAMVSYASGNDIRLVYFK